MRMNPSSQLSRSQLPYALKVCFFFFLGKQNNYIDIEMKRQQKQQPLQEDPK